MEEVGQAILIIMVAFGLTMTVALTFYAVAITVEMIKGNFHE